MKAVVVFLVVVKVVSASESLLDEALSKGIASERNVVGIAVCTTFFNQYLT